MFWASHDATARARSKQYQSAIFYHDLLQQHEAEESLRQQVQKTGKKIRTGVEQFQAFHLAEDYHQKYYLKQNSRLTRELCRIYPEEALFTASTVTARFNGFAGGHLSFTALVKSLEGLGLEETSRNHLLELI